jgi:hypothetical protein
MASERSNAVVNDMGGADVDAVEEGGCRKSFGGGEKSRSAALEVYASDAVRNFMKRRGRGDTSSGRPVER